eukprot:4813694-Amphidinium_carterae.1
MQFSIVLVVLSLLGFGHSQFASLYSAELISGNRTPMSHDLNKLSFDRGLGTSANRATKFQGKFVRNLHRHVSSPAHDKPPGHLPLGPESGIVPSPPLKRSSGKGGSGGWSPPSGWTIPLLQPTWTILLYVDHYIPDHPNCNALSTKALNP